VNSLPICMTSPARTAILGDFASRRHGVVFKITAIPHWSKHKKPAFIAFLKSVSFGAPAATAAPAMGHEPVAAVASRRWLERALALKILWFNANTLVMAEWLRTALAINPGQFRRTGSS